MAPTTRLILPALALLLVPAAPAPASEPDERVQLLLVFGDDPCPQSDGDSIVVCARKPESERYRIPKDLRQKAATVGEQGWGSTVQTLETASRALLPNSCTPVGINGFTGCSLAMLRQWFAERQLDGQAPPAR